MEGGAPRTEKAFSLSKDGWAGLLCLAVGLAALFIARDYDFGSARAMGPGFFPIVLGGVIALLGLSLLISGLRNADSSAEAEPPFAARALVVIMFAMLSFAFLIRSAGLAAAVVALVVLGRIAGRDYGWLETAVLSVVLVAIAALVFVIGLNMPLRLMPWR
jgi:hypothetical protein